MVHISTLAHTLQIMNKRTIILLLLIVATTLSISAQTVIVDSESGRPLGGILVFTKNGSFIDITDSLGHLPQKAMNLDGVILQDISHKSITAKLPADTLRMEAMEYPLEEVRISSKADYIRLRGYYRNYSIANDTMIIYEDGMADYYIPMKEGKTRCIPYMSRQGVPGKSPLNFTDWGQIFDDYDIEKETLMAIVRERKRLSTRDTVSYVRTDTIGGTTSVYLDDLACDKNHSITINFLVKIQQTAADEMAVYKYDPTYESQSQLMSFCNHSRVYVSGKLLRKRNAKGKVPFSKICQDDFREFYVVNRSIVSKEQMKDAIRGLKKGDKEAIENNFDKECTIPDFVPKLNDRLLQQLDLLKELTKDNWQGKVIITPTKDNK